jgi:hypothetical protein
MHSAINQISLLFTKWTSPANLNPSTDLRSFEFPLTIAVTASRIA